MATPMEEEVQGSSPAVAEGAEGGSPEKPMVELPAPEGWKKKLIPRKRRDEIVYITPTGEEIKSRTQLDRYLKSHPGGPPSSEFHWGTGTTPRRSSRLTDKIQAESQTPESESKKTPKRSRKSDAGSEDTKKSTKRQKSEDAAEQNEEDKEVNKDESMKEDKLEETRLDDNSGKEEDIKAEEQEMKQDDKVEGSKAEDVEMQETVETGEDKAEEGKEAPVEEDKAVMKESEDYSEEGKVNKEPEVVEEKPCKEPEVEEEKLSKEPEVEEEKPSKEPEVEEEKPSKEPEVQSEEKFENEREVQLEAKFEKEPEVQVAEYSVVNDHDVNIQEEAKKDEAEEEKFGNKGAHENGVDIEPRVPTHAEPQEPLDAKNENGHSGIVLQDHSEQQKSVEPMKEMSDDSKAKYSTSDAPRTEELQSSNSSALQQPSEQLGTSS